MKGELVSLINQRLALGVTDTSTILAMNAHRSLLDIFVSSAHAQTTDSILIQKNPIKYSVSLYDPTTLGTHFYANGATHDLYVKRQENKASIASTSITEIENRAIEEAHWKTYTAIKTELLKKLITECT
jgi:hypothetical protein